MEIRIKNMVCRHCVAAVDKLLHGMGLKDYEVTLGRVSMPDCEAERIDLGELDKLLCENGFERIVDRNTMIVEDVKRLIIRHVRIERDCPLNLSECLEKHLNMTYDTISRIFSSVEKRTVEKYFITQKIELVKELLDYNTMTISEIADLTGYSSVSHLSRQFKEMTGMTPSQYLRQESNTRLSIADL